MRSIRFAAISCLLVLTAFVKSGPPWISVEYPANPYDSASRDALMLVHTFHHGTPVGFPLSGTAEGIVAGARRTVSLEFKSTSRPGVYALRKQWADQGVWTLVLGATQGTGENNTAYAVVEIGATGEVTSVRVPTRRMNGYLVPAPVAMADIEAGLRERAGRVATR